MPFSSREEAQDFLYEQPKEALLEPEDYDTMVRLIREGNPPLPGLRVNDLGEIVLGGGVSADGDLVPIFRWSRAPQT